MGRGGDEDKFLRVRVSFFEQHKSYFHLPQKLIPPKIPPKKQLTTAVHMYLGAHGPPVHQLSEMEQKKADQADQVAPNVPLPPDVDPKILEKMLPGTKVTLKPEDSQQGSNALMKWFHHWVDKIKKMFGGVYPDPTKEFEIETFIRGQPGKVKLKGEQGIIDVALFLPKPEEGAAGGGGGGGEAGGGEGGGEPAPEPAPATSALEIPSREVDLEGEDDPLREVLDQNLDDDIQKQNNLIDNIDNTNNNPQSSFHNDK